MVTKSSLLRPVLVVVLGFIYSFIDISYEWAMPNQLFWWAMGIVLMGIVSMTNDLKTWLGYTVIGLITFFLTYNLWEILIRAW